MKPIHSRMLETYLHVGLQAFVTPKAKPGSGARRLQGSRVRWPPRGGRPPPHAGPVLIKIKPWKKGDQIALSRPTSKKEINSLSGVGHTASFSAPLGPSATASLPTQRPLTIHKNRSPPTRCPLDIRVRPPPPHFHHPASSPRTPPPRKQGALSCGYSPVGYSRNAIGFNRGEYV